MRKQKAKEKRSKQSEVILDLEKMDVMLGSYPRDNYETQEEKSENEMDLMSNRQY